MITQENMHCFYMYNNQPMGFEYDLAKAFADNLGVSLKVRVASSWQEMVTLLENRQGDFIARSILPPTKSALLPGVTAGYLSIRHHILTHRNNSDVQHVSDLKDRTVHVRKNSACHEILLKLQKKNIEVNIVPVEKISQEALIRQIADQQGDMEITLAPRDMALLYRRYYPQLNVADPVDRNSSLKWIVHPYARKLRFRINTFFRNVKKNDLISKTHDRYYFQLQNFDYVDLMRYHRSLEHKLPRYIDILKDAADCYDFDWRLIAAQMYQESRFNPAARSYAGAQGLMQLTVPTARSHNVKNILNPRQNIFGGVKQLHYLYNLYSGATAPDRIRLSLGAYNVGQGHLQDAQKLAVKKQLDPDKWSSLAITLPLLQFPQYYRETRYGYCRGSEPVKYIQQIMIYYDILKYKRSIEERERTAALYSQKSALTEKKEKLPL